MAELNGCTVQEADLERLALVNYGHFTTLRVEQNQVRGLALHLERLRRDCATLFDASLDLNYVQFLIRQATEGHAQPCIVRVTLFDPALQLGHPGANAKPQVLTTTRPCPTVALSPLRVQTTCYSRELPTVKHVGLCAGLFHRRRAQRAGYDDVLFTDTQGHVCEGSTWNVALFDGQQLIWPQGPALPGVTMSLLRHHYHGAMVARPVMLDELPSMQAVFATNAVVGLRPVQAIGDFHFGVAEALLQTLQQCYQAIPPEPL